MMTVKQLIEELSKLPPDAEVDHIPYTYKAISVFPAGHRDRICEFLAEDTLESPPTSPWSIEPLFELDEDDLA